MDGKKWRWVDDKGRPTTDWMDVPMPPMGLRKVSDGNGTIHVQEKHEGPCWRQAHSDCGC